MSLHHRAPRATAVRGGEDPWLYRFGAAPEAARCTLVCLPCAGCSSAMYASWAAELPADVGIAAARLPGREARLAEPPFKRMEAFVEAFLPTLRQLARRPYALFGHSMGALMAYALVTALPEAVPPPRHLFLSAHRPPQLDLGREPIAEKPQEAFLAAVQAMGGLPEEVSRHPELLELIVPPMRADFRLCETYPRGPDSGPSPLRVPVTVFGGREDGNATPAAMERWGELCDDLRGVHILPGDHFYLRDHRPALLAAIAAVLREVAGP
ncbi:thioesterase II family protein [Endothiovibrio diazotrophicus]